ncbi:MAG: hypothetical protein Q8932_03455, partial [Bacteroidota bacterium]|nr:hypothetical protein [Bacteroidota bacterium]
MKKTTLLLALLPLTFLPLVRGLYAQESTAQTHAGHFLFRVPEGWKTTQQGDLFSMTPPDLGSDELLSFLFLAPVTDTGFLAVADATISQVATAMQGTGITQPFANHPLYFQL